MDILNLSTEVAGTISDWEDGVRFLGIKVINVSDFTELILRFILNLSLIFMVVHFMYRRVSKRKDFYFSYLAIGTVIFLLCFLLNSVKLEMGFALGLFAIFGIIRYRTDAIPIKEMTYLFVIIGISVINALASKKVSYSELLFTNAAIVSGLWILERCLMLKPEGRVDLIYEKIENIHSDNKHLLLEDLTKRIGVEVKRYDVKKIDFLKDVAELTLYFDITQKEDKDDEK